MTNFPAFVFNQEVLTANPPGGIRLERSAFPGVARERATPGNERNEGCNPPLDSLTVSLNPRRADSEVRELLFWQMVL